MKTDREQIDKQINDLERVIAAIRGSNQLQLHDIDAIIRSQIAILIMLREIIK